MDYVNNVFWPIWQDVVTNAVLIWCMRTGMSDEYWQLQLH